MVHTIDNLERIDERGAGKNPGLLDARFDDLLHCGLKTAVRYRLEADFLIFEGFENRIQEPVGLLSVDLEQSLF